MNRIILILTFLLAFFLRFFNLTEAPPSLSHDEVAIGYNAFSILKTGKDEYGNFLPLLFKSFDDYKLPGMVYATVLPIKLFGLNEFSVRLPSALFGFLTVVVFYGICKELVGKNTVSLKKFLLSQAQVITFFFAVSMWHINFSRQSFESNGAVFFLTLGVYLLLQSAKMTRLIYLILSALSFVAALYFYYSVRLIIPFIIFSYLLVFKDYVWKMKNYLLITCIVGLTLTGPLLVAMFSKEGLSRVNLVNVTKDINYIQRVDTFFLKRATSNRFYDRLIFSNKSALLFTVAENYVKNLQPEYIFIKGLNITGLQYPLELPFMVIGVLMLITLKNPLKWVIFTWLICAILPGALSINQPNALRTLPNAPMFAFLSGFGFIAVYTYLKRNEAKIFFLCICVAIFSYSFIHFFQNYFYDYPRQNAIVFADGSKQMARYVNENKEQYDQIYISGYFWRPYIFLLFWQAIDPAYYQNSGSRFGFDKYIFTSADWDHGGSVISKQNFNFNDLVVADKKRTLFILASKDYEIHKEKFTFIDTIHGKHALNVYIAASLK